VEDDLTRPYCLGAARGGNRPKVIRCQATLSNGLYIGLSGKVGIY
jgi:hypothetical protein